MTVSPLVTTIVVNWNGQAYLEKCLASLRAQRYQPHEIIMVDNGSIDGSIDLVETHFPEVRLIRLSHNLGFAGANNLAIRESSGAYVAVLNNDAYAEPDWLSRMVSAAESDPGIGSIACKLLFANPANVINSAGLVMDWAGFTWDWRGGQLDDPSETQIEECLGASGAAALYRRAMLDDIGLYDEDFFAYAEDADLNWRAQKAGWRCVYVPAARAYHVASATLGEGSRSKTYLQGRNKVWLLAKNLPTGRYLLYVPLMIAYDLLADVWGLFKRRDVGAIAGRGAGLRGLRRMLRKRRLMVNRSVAYLELIKPPQWPWQTARRFKHVQARIEAQQRGPT
jgi:GT2 family glycosyltransferase